MPLARPTPERTSSTLRDFHTSSRGATVTRMNRLLAELHELETNPTPSPYFMATRISGNQTRAEVANDIILLARSLVDSLDKEYPYHG